MLNDLVPIENQNSKIENSSAPPGPSLPQGPHDGPKPKSKIAQLPIEQQNLINHLFDQGATYETVRARLAEQGVILNLKNLSDWYHGGYQEELLARERRGKGRCGDVFSGRRWACWQSIGPAFSEYAGWVTG